MSLWHFSELMNDCADMIWLQMWWEADGVCRCRCFTETTCRNPYVYRAKKEREKTAQPNNVIKTGNREMISISS